MYYLLYGTPLSRVHARTHVVSGHLKRRRASIAIVTRGHCSYSLIA